MLLDVRTYTCRPGTIKKHLALYEQKGKGPQTRHLGQPFAYLTTETGNVNQYIHIWHTRTPPTAKPAAPPCGRTPNGSRTRPRAPRSAPSNSRRTG